MDITISTKHAEITDALREYAYTKLNKLDRYFDGIVSCRAVLEIQGRRHQAEIELHVVRQGVIMAIAESEDMYRSIDTAASKIERQLKKYKGKLHNKQARKGI